MRIEAVGGAGAEAGTAETAAGLRIEIHYGVDAFEAEAGEEGFERLVTGEDDGVAEGQEEDASDVQFVTAGIEGRRGIVAVRDAPELQRFAFRQDGAIASELEVQREEDGLQIWEYGAEDVDP